MKRSDTIWLKPLRAGGINELPPAEGERYALMTHPRRNATGEIQYTQAGEPAGRWHVKTGDLVALYWSEDQRKEGQVVGVVRVLGGPAWRTGRRLIRRIPRCFGQ